MVRDVYLKGYEYFEEHLRIIKGRNSTEPLYFLFTGSKFCVPDSSLRISWCPDCVKAEPVINKCFDVAPENTNLITVEVGDKAFWQDFNCPFKTDPRVRLKVLPTLIKWKTEKRLEGDQLLNPELIDMLIADDD